MMFLSEQIYLLRTVMQLRTAIVQLTLQSDVFQLQLFVLLLQQTYSLLILALQLL